MYLSILLVLAAASVKEAAPHNAPRPPGPYWRDDRVLDLDTGAGAVTYINIYGSQLGSQGSSLQTETERSSDSDMWMDGSDDDVPYYVQRKQLIINNNDNNDYTRD